MKKDPAQEEPRNSTPENISAKGIEEAFEKAEFVWKLGQLLSSGRYAGDPTLEEEIDRQKDVLKNFFEDYYKAAIDRAVNDESERVSKLWPEYEKEVNSDSTNKFLDLIDAPTAPINNKSFNYFKFDLFYAVNGDVELLRAGVTAALNLFRSDRTEAQKLKEQLNKSATSIWPAVDIEEETKTRHDDSDIFSRSDKWKIAEDEGKKRSAILHDFIVTVTGESNTAPRITVTQKGVPKVGYPLDKVNTNIWTLLNDADQTGQLEFAVERKGTSKPASIIYSINFDGLEAETGVTIIRKLTAYDKRCYIATAALFNNNSTPIFTVAQIYAAMGNTGKPSANDIKKINNSLTKMMAAHIYLNNESEHSVYPKMQHYRYDGSLLPMERITAIVNGQPVGSAIHLFREPPMYTFAKERNQLTTINMDILTSPVSKTDANLQLDDYLIERIAHIKKSAGKMSNKILFATIFAKTGHTSRNQKSRGRETVKKYLEHYKKCKFIRNYTEGKDGVTIEY